MFWLGQNSLCRLGYTSQTQHNSRMRRRMRLWRDPWSVFSILHLFATRSCAGFLLYIPELFVVTTAVPDCTLKDDLYSLFFVFITKNSANILHDKRRYSNYVNTLRLLATTYLSTQERVLLFVASGTILNTLYIANIFWPIDPLFTQYMSGWI